MLLGFKTELHPSNKQKTLLAKHAGVARHIQSGYTVYVHNSVYSFYSPSGASGASPYYTITIQADSISCL
ncbi:MAG: helix-turn-helix domain-containing protein [Trichodesmium sp.]